MGWDKVDTYFLVTEVAWGKEWKFSFLKKKQKINFIVSVQKMYWYRESTTNLLTLN